MKKKIKDLTYEEAEEYCDNVLICKNCPLYTKKPSAYYCYFDYLSAKKAIDEGTIDIEMEIEL